MAFLQIMGVQSFNNLFGVRATHRHLSYIYWRAIFLHCVHTSHITYLPIASTLSRIEFLTPPTHRLHPQDEQAKEQQDVTHHGEDRSGV